MILGLQIVGILFSLAMIYFALLHYKKSHLTGVEVVSWTSIWIVTILIVIFPEVIRVYAAGFAISRLLDLLVAGGFLVLFTMAFISYARISRIERKLEDLIRKLALKENDKKK